MGQQGWHPVALHGRRGRPRGRRGWALEGCPRDHQRYCQPQRRWIVRRRQLGPRTSWVLRGCRPGARRVVRGRCPVGHASTESARARFGAHRAGPGAETGRRWPRVKGKGCGVGGSSTKQGAGECDFVRRTRGCGSGGLRRMNAQVRWKSGGVLVEVVHGDVPDVGDIRWPAGLLYVVCVRVTGAR